MRVRLMQAVNFDDPLSPLRITNLSEACRPPTPIPSPTFPSTPRVCAFVHVSAFHPRELGRPEHAHVPHPDHARSVSAVRGWRQRNRASRASRHPSGPDPPHRIAVASGISMTLSRSCSVGHPPTTSSIMLIDVMQVSLVCVRACVRACVCSCVRACVRVCVCVFSGGGGQKRPNGAAPRRSFQNSLRPPARKLWCPFLKCPTPELMHIRLTFTLYWRPYQLCQPVALA